MFKPKPIKPVLYEFVFWLLKAQKGLFNATLRRIDLLRASYVFISRKIRLLAGLFVLSLMIWLPLSQATPAHAATPTLNFQARLENSTGGIASDGNYNVEFNLYQGGTEAGGGTLKWTETRKFDGGPDNRVHVANGYLTVNLGSVTNFPGTINWDDDLFLTMNIGGTTTGTPSWDGEMNPRLKLTSVPYAFQAASAHQLQAIQGGYTGTLNFDNLTADRNFLLPDTSLATVGSPATICVFNGATSNCPAATGSAYYIHNDQGLQTSANFNIQGANDLGSGTDGTVAGILRAAAGGQTVDIFQIQNAGGTPIAAFTANGDLQVASSVDTRTGTTLSVGTANATSITIAQSGVGTTVAGSLTVDEATTLTGGATIRGVTVDTATATDDLLNLSIAPGGTNRFTGTITAADLTGNHTWTLPDEDGTICTDAVTSTCNSLGSYIQNQSAAPQSGSTFWIDGVGRSDTSFLAPAVDTAVAGTLSLGTTTATAVDIAQSGVATTIQGSLTVDELTTFNDDVTIAAGKTLRITGGNTASHAAAPTSAGQIYFDTDTNQLLTSVYNSDTAAYQWKAASQQAILVAASDSSTADKQAADYVADGTADQVEINYALTKATGGKVYLFPGTYVADGTITIPNATALYGTGRETSAIKLDVGSGTDNLIENTGTFTIRDLGLDNSLSTGGTTQQGIYITGGGVFQSQITNVFLSNWANGDAIKVNNAPYVDSISDSVIDGNVSIVGSGSGSATLVKNFANNLVFGTFSVAASAGGTSGIYNMTNNAVVSGVSIDGSGSAVSFISGNTFGDVSITNAAAVSNFINNTVSSVVLSNVAGITVSNNTIANSSTDAISLTNADNIKVSNNTITNSGGVGYAININATSDGTYLGANTLGGYAINDLGTNTTYGGQVDDSNNYIIQPAGGAINLKANTNVTGNLAVSGTGTFSGGSLTVKTATVTDDSLVLSVATGGAAAFTGTITNTNLTAARTWTLPDESGIICTNNVTGVCATAGTGYVQFAPQVAGVSTAQVDASNNNSIFINKTSGTGNILELQKAGTDVLAIANNGDATFSQNVTVAAGKYLKISGDTTANRATDIPSPTEGMLFYDTTTKKLLVYSNGKWQADRSTATKIVGTSATGGASSAVASVDADGADYVNTSTTSAQTVINNAINSLPGTGGSVYLMEGTYIIDGSINIPSNVTLTGTGASTIIKLKNSVGSDMDAIVNSDATNGNVRISLQNLRLDGNKANNGASIQRGIVFTKVSSVAATAGAKIDNVWVENFTNTGAKFLTTSNYTSVTNSVFQNNGSAGVEITGGLYLTIANNIFANNGAEGLWLNSSAQQSSVTGNVVQGNAGMGIRASNGSNLTITGNTVSGNTGNGIQVGGSNNTVVANTLINNAGSGSTDNLYVSGSNNTISNNNITDTAGTGYAINIASGTGNYVADNRFSGTGATTINNAGTDTVYGGQTNSSGNFAIQPASTKTIELLANTNVTGNLAVSGTGTFSGGSLTVKTATVTDDSLVLSVATGGAAAFTGTITNTNLTAARTWTLPDESGIICTNNVTGVCATAGTGYVQFAPQVGGVSTAQVDASNNNSIFINKTSGTGNILELQKAGTDVLAIANNGDATFSQNVTVAAGKTLQLLGGNTASHATAPTSAGKLYFDTDTNQLLTSVYNSDTAAYQWKASNQQAILVAASNSSVADKQAADYVADGTGDQTEINYALTKGAGKRVVLLPGTYVANGTILVPNNTVLAGTNRNATIIKLSVGAGTDNLIENSSAGHTNIIIQDLTLDGSLGSGGTQQGIYLNDGDISSRSSLKDLKFVSWAFGNSVALNTAYLDVFTGNSLGNVSVTGSQIKSFANNQAGNIAVSSTSVINNFIGNTFTNITIDASNMDAFTGNSLSAITLSNSAGITSVSGNSITGALTMSGSSTITAVTGNNIGGGITTSGSASIGLLSANAVGRLSLTNSSVITISGNNIIYAGTDNGIKLINTDSSKISGNRIVRLSGSAAAISIDATTDGTYLADNTTGAAGITDAGTNTVYGGQNDGTTYKIQPADDFTITGTTASTISTVAGDLTLQGGSGDVSLGTSTKLKANGALNITSGGATALGLDTGGAAAINIGGTNATSIVIGRTAAGQTLRLGQNSSTVQIDGTNFDVSTLGVVTLAGGQTADVVTAGATSLTIDTGGAAGITIGGTNANAITIGRASGGGAVNITGNAASTWKTTTGNLTIQAAADLTLNSTGSGAVNLGSATTATINIGSNATTTTTVLQAGASSGNGVAVQSSSATAFRVQNSAAAFTLFTADATATKRVTIGTTATPYGATSSNGDIMVVGNAEVQGRLYFGNSSNDAIYTSSAGGPLRFKGTARNDNVAVLTPEFAGATLNGTGIGTMTANFCGNSGSLSLNTGVCTTSGDVHNYYDWTNTTQASAQSYDVYTRWQVPSNADTSSLANFTMSAYGWRSTSSDFVQISVYDASGAVCASNVNVANTNTTWTTASVALSSCTFTAGSNVTIKVHMTATQNNLARAGEITINYKSQF